jgi:lipopolysaccharide biosynthesis regulator YciM
MNEIYDLAKAEMQPDEIGTHCSDLYLLKNSVSEKLVSQYEFRCNVTTFRSQIDGKIWFDIPFAYYPYFKK